VATKVFIDTMVFLHFQPLKKLPLSSLLQDDDITVVIPRITLRELDKHKGTHRKRVVKDRARRFLAELESAQQTRELLDGGIALEFFLAHPDDQLKRMKLDPTRADDELVAAVVAYREENPTAKVVVISQDSGPRITCRQFGIEAVALDASFALPEELDETEKENVALRQELQQFQNAMPHLIVRFHSGEGNGERARFTLRPHPELDESGLAKKLSKLRSDFPKMLVASETKRERSSLGSASSAMLAFANSGLGAISTEQILKYNAALDRYFMQMESHEREIHCWRGNLSRTIAFTLEVANEGKAPAEDVDICLEFPDGFELFASDDAPGQPDPPQPPTKPRSRVEEIQDSVRWLQAESPFDPSLLDFGPSSSFRIKATNGYEVIDHHERIKHNDEKKLPEISIEFPSVEAIRSFACKYRLCCANLPKAVEGTLHFIVEFQS